MRMSHTNYKNVIKGLGGDPMRFLLLLVHTLNVLINKFASGARHFFLIFQCHTVTNGTDLRRSPLKMKPSDMEKHKSKKK